MRELRNASASLDERLVAKRSRADITKGSLRAKVSQVEESEAKVAQL